MLNVVLTGSIFVGAVTHFLYFELSTETKLSYISLIDSLDKINSSKVTNKYLIFYLYF